MNNCVKVINNQIPVVGEMMFEVMNVYEVRLLFLVNFNSLEGPKLEKGHTRTLNSALLKSRIKMLVPEFKNEHLNSSITRYLVCNKKFLLGY